MFFDASGAERIGTKVETVNEFWVQLSCSGEFGFDFHEPRSFRRRHSARRSSKHVLNMFGRERVSRESRTASRTLYAGEALYRKRRWNAPKRIACGSHAILINTYQRNGMKGDADAAIARYAEPAPLAVHNDVLAPYDAVGYGRDAT
jgi:hypothetical protein